MNKRFDSGMIAVDNGGVSGPGGLMTNIVQQLVKFCRDARVRGEPNIRMMNSAVGLKLVIPNGTFRPRHGLLLLVFLELDS